MNKGFPGRPAARHRFLLSGPFLQSAPQRDALTSAIALARPRARAASPPATNVIGSAAGGGGWAQSFDDAEPPDLAAPPRALAAPSHPRQGRGSVPPGVRGRDSRATLIFTGLLGDQH